MLAVKMKYEIHQCDELPKDGIQLYRNKSGKGGAGKKWILSIMREATEKDLEENHFLELVGDTIWETQVAVKCCPYCGEKLPDFDEPEQTEFTWFEHYDHAEWSVKIR